MATRTVFYVNEKNEFVKSNIYFKWNPGFSEAQTRKNVDAVHKGFLKQHPGAKILEVSSSATDPNAIKASAFNLQVRTTHGNFTVEQVFQAGKVFKKNGIQNRLLTYSPQQAKKIIKQINANDQLVGFEEFGSKFPLEPKTYFYNWIYICTVTKAK